MILACHNLNKSFGDHLIVRDGSFHVEDREKAALVGVNGAGKSTIFKMIVGELPLDEGDVILTKGKTLGYLAQHQNLDTTNTIYEELKTAKSDIIALEAQIRAIELDPPREQGSPGYAEHPRKRQTAKTGIKSAFSSGAGIDLLKDAKFTELLPRIQEIGGKLSRGEAKTPALRLNPPHLLPYCLPLSTRQ